MPEAPPTFWGDGDLSFLLSDFLLDLDGVSGFCFVLLLSAAFLSEERSAIFSGDLGGLPLLLVLLASCSPYLLAEVCVSLAFFPFDLVDFPLLLDDIN